MKGLISLLMFISLCCYAALAQPVQKLSAVKANDYGIVYTLPVTTLDVTIEVELTEREPGEFYKYAKKYLNVDDPITEPSFSAEVKSVAIGARGIPDQERRYLVTLKSSNSPYIILSEDNIPLAINTEETFDVAGVTLPESKAADPTPLETSAARQVVTEEMLRSHSSAKRAELAAEQIYALRQSRTDLITGQADQMPPDGQAMKLVLDNIEAQEQALVAMFVGTEKCSTEVETVQYYPDGDAGNVVIARVSPIKGIVSPDDLSGSPVYLSVNVMSQGELPVNEKGERLPFPKGGVAYCIPGKAAVEVSYDGRMVERKEVDLAQFGVIYGLNPSNFTDKKSPICLIFDPATGGASRIAPAPER